MPLQIFQKTKRKMDEIDWVHQMLEAAMDELKLNQAIVELVIIGEKRMIALNSEYKNKNRVTDVLSFILEPEAIFDDIPWFLGSIYICLPVAIRQAKARQSKLSAHVIRLAIHGLVHLTGLDHERSSREYEKFKKIESKLLIGKIKDPMPL